MSVDSNDNSVKLVTQWNMSSISYNDDSTTFEGSHMKMWLNDTTVDGFLGNLREPEKFIKMDSKWNTTMTTEITKPGSTTIVETPVGLLNIYEYAMSYNGVVSSNSYLNNGLSWWSITPYNSLNIWEINFDGNVGNFSHVDGYGVRPSINLKPGIKTTDGNGTEDDPYRLEGDDDKKLSNVYLKERFSGEYIRFGTGENNLYRIVSHETEGLTKVTTAFPLKDNGSFKMLPFGTDTIFSQTDSIGSFLNGEYLTSGLYFTNEQLPMIEDSTIWYLGAVNTGENYRLSKYTNTTDNTLTSNITTAKVGLLRMGELMSSQFNRYEKNNTYWLITPASLSNSINIFNYGYAFNRNVATEMFGIMPAFNLKSNIVITSGDGTLQNPFQLSIE